MNGRVLMRPTDTLLGNNGPALCIHTYTSFGSYTSQTIGTQLTRQTKIFSHYRKYNTYLKYYTGHFPYFTTVLNTYH